MRSLLIFVAGLLVGAPAGAFLWYAFSPLLFDVEVAETLTEAEVVAEGQFGEIDRVHSGSGTARIVRLADGSLEVQLADFQVTNGPDLEVWLSAHDNPRENADVRDNPWLALGQLKGNVGDQSYPVPAGTDLSEFNSVVIWCEQFGVLFSPAPLAPPA